MRLVIVQVIEVLSEKGRFPARDKRLVILAETDYRGQAFGTYPELFRELRVQPPAAVAGFSFEFLHGYRTPGGGIPVDAILEDGILVL